MYGIDVQTIMNVGTKSNNESTYYFIFIICHTTGQMNINIKNNQQNGNR